MPTINLNKRYNLNIEIDQLVYDTRDIDSKNALFFCINETSYDYVKQAVERGAKLIVSDRKLDESINHVVVDDVLLELSSISDEFYGFPASMLNFIGVTGTDGKTTTSQIIQQLLIQLEDNCGYIGTNGVVYKGFSEKYFCTVPFPPLLHKSLSDMVNAGEKNVVIEATSQGLELKRLENINFNRVVFTNFSPDHLDFHHTLENYLDAKLRVLELTNDDSAVILNVDDPKHLDFINKSNGISVLTYGIENSADYKAENINFFSNKITFDIVYNDCIYNVNSKMIGKFNVYNLLAAIATLHSLGYDLNKLVQLVSKLDTVEGRTMFVENNLGVDIIIDFAHTSNAVDNILSFLRTTSNQENRRLVSLMGVPGRRDKTKRPLIGKLLTQHSDYVYFTSDDPRDEDPKVILEELTSQVVHDKYEKIVDRKAAIKKMITESKPGDILVLLGKGSENKFAIGLGLEDYLEEDVVKDVLATIESK